MPRPKLIHSNVLPYHLTARTNNREIFPGDLSFIWKTLTSELYLQVLLRRVRVHAFVLMPNHFHLLMTTPEDSISKVMQCFISASTRIINTRYRRSGRLFGSRYRWSLIDSPFYYAHALRYVYRNPIQAGLSTSVSDYDFSTLSGLTGKASLPIPLCHTLSEIDRFVPVDDPFALEKMVSDTKTVGRS